MVSILLAMKYFIYLFVLLFRTAPPAYEVSQARDQTGVTAASLCQGHMISELHLRPTPQITATPDP